MVTNTSKNLKTVKNTATTSEIREKSSKTVKKP